MKSGTLMGKMMDIFGHYYDLKAYTEQSNLLNVWVKHTPGAGLFA